MKRLNTKTVIHQNLERDHEVTTKSKPNENVDKKVVAVVVRDQNTKNHLIINHAAMKRKKRKNQKINKSLKSKKKN